MPLNPADPLVALATELSRQPPLLARLGPAGPRRAAQATPPVRLLPEEWAMLFPDLPPLRLAPPAPSAH